MRVWHVSLSGFKEFLESYVDCALWLLTDDNGEPVKGQSEQDLSPELKDQILADCWGFWTENCHMIGFPHCKSAQTPAQQAGHDFWLTRNGHGAGFWDGGWTEEIGDTLTTRAKVYGASEWYFGDDGRIYA
jgi:hypothetical protein